MTAWKSLTDRDWVNVVNSDAVKAEGDDVHGAVCAAFKLIEAKLREKNEEPLANDVTIEHARALAEQVMGMEMLSARGLRAKELARTVLGDGEEPVAESRCGNCGTPASKAEGHITEYDEGGDWFCSEQCYDQHAELGCPHEHHNGYRHPAEAARLIEAEEALRSLASYLGCGGYNAPEVDAKVFEEKIRYGIDNFVRPAKAACGFPACAVHHPCTKACDKDEATLWRPIEEAPEWTFVLVVEDGQIAIAQRQGEFGWHDEEPRFLRSVPTAWMPLPKAPGDQP